jgi:LPS export ABC transporter protein LptC
MTRSRFFWILSAALVIVFIIILGYKEQSVKISPSFKTSTMNKLQMTHKEDNKIEWELSAREAFFPADKKEILLHSIGLTINYSPNTKDGKFTADTLKWNSKDKLITTKDDVTFSGKTFFIEGKGLMAETDRQKVRILKNVKAVFYH